MAIGRVGLAEGVKPLTGALADADPEVREMAAFALGLIADASAAAPLTTALADAVTDRSRPGGRSAGLIGSAPGGEAAGARRGRAIGRMAAEYARSAAVRAVQPDDETWPAAPEVEAFRLGIYALVRLHAYEPLVGGGPRQRVAGDDLVAGRLCARPHRGPAGRAGPAEAPRRARAGTPPAFAARGLGVIKARAAVAPLNALVQQANTPTRSRRCRRSELSAALAILRPVPPLVELASDPATDPNVRLEVVTALGALKAADGLPLVQDLLSDPWPAMRAAALRAAAAIDPDSFVAGAVEHGPRSAVERPRRDRVGAGDVAGRRGTRTRAGDAARRGQAGLPAGAQRRSRTSRRRTRRPSRWRS